MKKQILAIVFLILIAAGGAFAQTVEQQVAKIRQITVDTNKEIDAGLKDKTSGLHYAAWTVGGARDGQQWGAVGTMQSANEYYFDCEPERLEICDTTDIKTLVRKIVSSYQGAADLRTKSEYFFEGKTGELVFAFTSELEADGKTTERRFYFNKGKLIRLARAGKNTDANFSAEDYQKAADEAGAAKYLREIFARMFSDE